MSEFRFANYYYCLDLIKDGKKEIKQRKLFLNCCYSFVLNTTKTVVLFS